MKQPTDRHIAYMSVAVNLSMSVLQADVDRLRERGALYRNLLIVDIAELYEQLANVLEAKQGGIADAVTDLFGGNVE